LEFKEPRISSPDALNSNSKLLRVVLIDHVRVNEPSQVPSHALFLEEANFLERELTGFIPTSLAGRGWTGLF